MKRLFFIDGQFFPVSEVPDPESWERSLLWHCNQCGEVYARIPIVDGDKTNMWTALGGCCKKCPPTYRQIPGSIWNGYNFNYTSKVPIEIMRRELELTLKAYEDGII